MDVQRIATGFGYLLASQVSSRLVTFALNLLVARHLAPEAYGLSAIQFHLLTTTIMMLSREGFRRGCMRLQPQGDAKLVDPWHVLRVSWLVLPVGVLVSLALCGATIWRHNTSSSSNDVPAYAPSIALHGVAAVVELASEPLYILASVNLQYRQRVIMDSAPLAAKSLLTLACVAGWLGPRLQALPPAMMFAYAQLVFAAATLLGYLLTVGLPLVMSGRLAGHRSQAAAGSATSSSINAQGRSITNTAGRGSSTQDGTAQAPEAQVAGKGGTGSPAAGLRHNRAGLLRRWWSPEELQVLGSTAVFSMQAAVKLVLAEGSKLVLAQVSSGYDQGVVGLVTNLGSLVVRTVFQPLEEVAFTAFSRQHASPKDVQALTQQLQVLRLMCKAVSLLGALAVVAGPPNTWLAIRLVYGPTWAATEAPAVLAVYCSYILLLAINGVTEAFVHAVLDNRSLARSNALLLAPTVAHLLLCGLLIRRLGSVGFVAADAANMALRIAISLGYIRGHFKSLQGFQPAQLLLPGGAATLVTMVVAHLVMQASKVLLLPSDPQAGLPLMPVALHVGLTLTMLAAVAVAIARTEREAIQAVRSLLVRKRQGSSDMSAEQNAEDKKRL